ncbi:hypothetical protein ACGFXB_19715 [Streptomyces canus]|uniref:hypothetical protein n=1 Tax=Streptomyces canus TaxID=58343 RepID=UPI00370FBBF1
MLRARAERQRQTGPETLHWLLAEARDIDPSFFGVVRGCCGRAWNGWPGAREIPAADLIVDVIPPLRHR